MGNRRKSDADTREFMKLTPETVQLFNGNQSLRLVHGIPAGKWAHVAIVKEGPSVTCYVDGKEAGQGDANYPLPELPLYFGGDPKAGEMACCSVDEAAIYSRALTPTEVGRLTALETVEDGRIGQWAFEPEEDNCKRTFWVSGNPVASGEGREGAASGTFTVSAVACGTIKAVKLSTVLCAEAAGEREEG